MELVLEPELIRILMKILIGFSSVGVFIMVKKSPADKPLFSTRLGFRTKCSLHMLKKGIEKRRIKTFEVNLEI